MASSIDGKIIFDNWGDSVPKEKYSELYDKYHESYNSQGWIIGRSTAEKDFSKGIKPELIIPDTPIERKPHVHNKEAKAFAVVFDKNGKLGWNTNEIGGDHLIVILTEQVSDEYLYYLQRRGISYIFAGKEQADLKLAMAQLVDVFSIEQIMLEGGGSINGSLLNEGLIDEISLLLLPVADGTPDTASLFDISSNLRKIPATRLRLKSVEQLEDDVLWLRYSIDSSNAGI